ncbi:MAG: NAD(P)/FAD-dependent oxidoreductase [Dehalococcoidia bacterium]
MVGAGAAGLMAGITAGRAGRPAVILDGARVLGAKILVSGGGRCNVTHDVVDERAYAGSTPAAIRRVLRQFGVEQTVAFFSELGVELKREETGKLFPVTDRADTVLEALLRAAREAGCDVRPRHRVTAIEATGRGFRLSGAFGEIEARTLVLATGGRSLPKSGSDGAGFEFARGLGHTVTPRLLPALVGLTLERESPLRGLSGIATPVRLELRAGSGRRLHALDGSVLCTHFGVSGPAAMDISRYWQQAHLDDPGARFEVAWLPEERPESLDVALRELGGSTPLAFLDARLPSRLARVLCEAAGVDPSTRGHVLSREQRRALVRAVLEYPLPVTGTRGWNAAEATAGGIPLAEVHLGTMESRVAPGLFLCGEVLDVDGRIGGYNFQWAWSSGHVAGLGVAAARNLEGASAVQEA